MPATHVYEHPEGLGLGQHHAGEDLSAGPRSHPKPPPLCGRRWKPWIRPMSSGPR